MWRIKDRAREAVGKHGQIWGVVTEPGTSSPLPDQAILSPACPILSARSGRPPGSETGVSAQIQAFSEKASHLSGVSAPAEGTALSLQSSRPVHTPGRPQGSRLPGRWGRYGQTACCQPQLTWGAGQGLHRQTAGLPTCPLGRTRGPLSKLKGQAQRDNSASERMRLVCPSPSGCRFKSWDHHGPELALTPTPL